jgi:hypothetical protein
MHLALATWFVIGPFAVIVPLIMWQIKKDRSPFIDDHGREAINFQISINLYVLVSTLLLIVCVGWPMFVATTTLGIIGIVLASLAAHRGELRTLILPRGNAPDLDEIPEETRKAMTLILVDEVEEALQHAFSRPRPSPRPGPTEIAA